MKLEFDFTNGIEPVRIKQETVGATPMELLVSDTGSKGSRKDALMAYLTGLDYTFRGVRNPISGYIDRISVEKPWLGKMEKDGTEVNWDSVADKSFIVVYDVMISSIEEHMYVAEAFKQKRGDGDATGHVNAIWNDNLLNPAPPETLKGLLIKAISIASEYVDGYRLVFGHNGKDKISVLDRKDNEIAVDDIDDDESFIIIRLLFRLLSKGVHVGVFLINAQGLSDKGLNALVAISELFFGDTYLFLYNVRNTSSISRVQVTLPNFLANRG